MLHPVEYTALRNEFNAMWGLQQIIELAPTQAETLLNKAAASAKTAADIAAVDMPEPHLPPSGPVPRPDLLPPVDQEGTSEDPDSDEERNRQYARSMQFTAGDLYATAERGMVRTPGKSRLSSRQKIFLQTGMMRFQAPPRQNEVANVVSDASEYRFSTRYPTRVRSVVPKRPKPADTSPQQPASPELSPSAQQASDSRAEAASKDSLASLQPSNSDAPSQASASAQQTRAVSDSPGSETTGASQSSGLEADESEAAPKKKKMQGRPSRKVYRAMKAAQAEAEAKAEEAAVAERQKSGSLASASGRLDNILSPDQQRVRPS